MQSHTLEEEQEIFENYFLVASIHCMGASLQSNKFLRDDADVWQMPIVSRGVCGVDNDSFDGEFPLVERMGRETFWRLSDRKEGNVVVDVKVFWQERGEEGYEWNGKWKWTRMRGMVS